MATCAEVIRSAFRRAGVKARGVDLSASEQEVGLERLQGLYTQMAGGGTFGQLCDYYLTSGNYTAKENQRIYKADNTSVITIPTTVQDADTGKTRAPFDGAFVVIVDPNTTPTPAPEGESDAGFGTTYRIYDAGKGWSVINDLGPTDYAPLSGRWEEGVKSMLAVALCDEFGYAVPPVLARDAGLAKLRMISRYDQPRKPAKLDFS